MTYQQGLAFALVGLTIAAFIWGRFRYDVIALTALLAGVVMGVVPADEAFDGFSNDITVIIACALVVSAAFARSGLIEQVLRPLLPHLKTARSQVPVLVGAVTLLSMATKNVGALAILMPIALQVSKRTGTRPSWLLMPMAFGSLLGGLVTLVGTSPNIIVSEVRQEILGRPFGMFDYAPVGLVLALVGVAFLSFAYRLLPTTRHAAVEMDAALAAQPYITEVEVPEDWSPSSRRLGDILAKNPGEVSAMALLRGRRRRSSPHPSTRLQPGDVLLLQGDPEDLNELILSARFKLTRSDRPVAMEEPTEDVRVIEAVVGQDSKLIGQTAQKLDLHGQHGVNLLAVSRSGYRMTQELRTVRLRAGDVLVLQGGERTLPAALQDLGCLPLAEREVRLGGVRHSFAPALILAAAMLLVAFQIAPVAVAFFGAAVLMVAIGALRMREAYGALDGPVLVLVAALIPVSETIQSTGGADLIAGWLSVMFREMPPIAALGAVMAIAMAATPFLNNAATVLIVAPIGASLARQLGLGPDPFLMAVAVGAACDFLTPIGHQCNTLVMAPGGYKFADYPRLGAPLTVLVLVVGTPLIALVWGLAPA
jgi:di/tricarboxylate transporter